MSLDVSAADPGPARDFHWRAVLDVFEAFLATENPQVRQERLVMNSQIWWNEKAK